MVTWLDIDSAPEDDTEVLVFDPEHGVCLAECNLGDWLATCAGVYVNIGIEDVDLIHLKPTHWQPKPESPTPPT